MGRLLSVDQLLGVKAVKDTPKPKTARLINRLRRIEELPPADQRAVLRYLETLLERNRLAQNGNGRSRKAAR